MIKYFSQNEKVSIKLKDDFKTFTIEAIQFNIENMTTHDMNILANLDLAENYNNLVNDVIKKKWPKDESSESIFKFIFDCHPFLKVFVFMSRSVAKGDLEEKEIQIISLLDATLMDLSNGTIRLSLLELLNSSRKVLKEILELFSERLDTKICANSKEIGNIIDNIFEFRLDEVKIVKKFTSDMENLFSIMNKTNFYYKGLFENIHYFFKKFI